jgi:predicted phosphate transport protein (TIGR00153 family)
MLSWFQALLPKEEGFFDLFEAHSLTLCAGSRALQKLLQGGDEIAVHVAEIARYEEEADAVAHQVLLAVRRTFITPFDRSDIRSLIGSMDDAIDQMNKTAKAVTLFDQRVFEPKMVELGDLIVQTADLTAKAVPLLRSMRRSAKDLNAIAEEVAKLEERSDVLCDQGKAALFHGQGRTDPMAFIAGSEIYDNLEKVVDRFEDVANEISGVLIEQL